MKSFNSVFEDCRNEASKYNLETEIFPSFRDKPGPYRFLTAVKDQYWKKDEEALNIAVAQNKELTAQYLSKIKPDTGYSSREQYVELDTIDCRHVMMNAFIFSHIGKSVGNVVEVGAGFGNWIRLNENIVDFKTWTMVDIGFVSQLQKWYTDQTLSNKHLARFVSFDDRDSFNQWVESLNPIDLTIGSHSLSEISIDIFNLYLEKILPKTRYLFYATHKYQPSKALINSKLELLSQKFNIVKQVENQHGKCLNILYEAKR